MNALTQKPAGDFVTCPLCDVVDAPANLSLVRGRVMVECAHCASRFELGAHTTKRPALRLVPETPAPSLTPGANPFSPPGTCCAKCAAPRRSWNSCAQCGADFAKLDVASLQPPAWLKERWVALWRTWNDPSAHAALLDEAVQRDALPTLARLYRVRLAWASRDPQAESALAEVVKRAALPMAQNLREDLSPRRRRRLIGALVVVSSMLVGVMHLMAR